MSTVIKGIKFSNYSFSSEEAANIFNSQNLNDNSGFSAGSYFIIVPEPDPGDEKNFEELVNRLTQLKLNPWWSYLEFKVCYQYSKYWGWSPIIVCEEKTHEFIKGYVLARS